MAENMLESTNILDFDKIAKKAWNLLDLIKNGGVGGRALFSDIYNINNNLIKQFFKLKFWF